MARFSKEEERAAKEVLFQNDIMNGLKPVMIEYNSGFRFNNIIYYYDIITFDSDEEKEAYINGEVAYDYIDNSQKLHENEKVIKK